MTDGFRLRLDAALSTVDYRDPDILKRAAQDIDTTLTRLNRMISDKRAELVKMTVACKELAELRDRLNQEAGWLRNRADFERTNETRIAGESKNPEVRT